MKKYGIMLSLAGIALILAFFFTFNMSLQGNKYRRVHGDVMEPSRAILYLAGEYDRRHGQDLVKKACYWRVTSKGINRTDLPGDEAFAGAIRVNGSTIDTVGSYFDGNQERACLWQTTPAGIKRTNLPGNQSYAESMDVWGSRVYIAGSYQTELHGLNITVPCYWIATSKRIMRRELPLPKEARHHDSSAQSIFLTEHAIYIAGSYFDGSTNVACYWRSTSAGTTRTDLPGGNNGVNSMAVLSDSVYIMGEDFEGESALFWTVTPKRITRTELPGDNASAKSVSISGDTLYIAGSDQNGEEDQTAACFWTFSPRGITRAYLEGNDSYANSIDLLGQTVYTTGKYHKGPKRGKGERWEPAGAKEVACYWVTTRAGTKRVELPCGDNDYAEVNSVWVSQE